MGGEAPLEALTAVSDLAVSLGMNGGGRSGGVTEKDIARMTAQHDSFMLEEVCEYNIGNRIAKPRPCFFAEHCVVASYGLVRKAEEEREASEPVGPMREYLTPAEDRTFMESGESPKDARRGCVVCERALCAMTARMFDQGRRDGAAVSNWFSNASGPDEYRKDALVGGDSAHVFGEFCGPNLTKLLLRRARSTRTQTGKTRWVVDQGGLLWSEEPASFRPRA